MQKPYTLIAILICTCLLPVIKSFAQVGISNVSITPDASTILELRSTTAGFLPPRMTTAQRDVIGAPATGLLIYNVTTNQLNYYSGSLWQVVSGGLAVNAVSVTTANGVSGTVANATTTPAISLTLGAITPASVAATGAVTGANLSGINTGDQSLASLGAQPQLNGTGIVKASGTSITYDNSTYITNANVVFNNQANTYTGGMKQSFSSSATTAGINIGGITADPSGLSSGDYWYRSDLGKIYYRDGVTSRPLVSEALVQTLTNKNLGSPTNTFPVFPISNGGTNSSTGLNNNRIMVSSGGSIVEGTALTNGQLLIGSGGAAPVAANLSAGNGIVIYNSAGAITIANEPTIFHSTGTSTLTTTSTTDVAFNTPLSVTPGAGDYLVFFTGVVSNSSSGKGVIISVYVNGIKLAYTETQSTSGQTNDKNSIATNAYITGLGASQAIEIRWKAESNTASITNRSLIVQKIK